MPAVLDAIPELGLLIAVVFLLLIALALWVLQGVITNSLGRLPVVGSWVASNMNSALNDARNAVLAAATSSWGAAVQLFRWTEEFITAVGDSIFNGLVSTFVFAQRVYDVTLPNLENRVLADASGWASSAETYAAGLVLSAESYAAGLVSSAETTVTGWVITAETDAISLFDRATADIASGVTAAETYAANAVLSASTELGAEISAAESWAAGQISGLESSVQRAIDTLSGDITAGVQTAEAVAAASLSAAVGAIYTDLDTAADTAIRDAWPDATGELAHLGGTLGADFPWLKDLLGALGGLGVAGLAGSLIRSMATSQALTRLADDCIVPQCRNLGGLSNDLGNLLSDASTAAMLAWLIFAVTDPAGWSSEMVTVAAPVASGLATDAAHLFGEA